MNVRCVRFALLSLVFLTIILTPAARAVEPITMEVASPFMTVPKPLTLAVRAGRWFPVAVTLSNTGDAVQGRLTLRLITEIGDGVPNSEFFTDVDLPANASRKRVWLYGRLEREDIGEMEIRFQGRGFRALKATGRIDPLDPQTRSVLTISDADERLTYLKSLSGPGLEVAEEKQLEPEMSGIPKDAATNAPRSIVTLGTTRGLVPSRWIGLDAADVVVLHDFPHTSLSPAQLAALRGYVAGGGTLLALGGTDWQRLAQSPLANWWPITPTSSETASSSEVNRLVQSYVRVKNPTAGDRLGGAPVVVTRGVLRPDATGSNDTGSPLLFKRNLGAGHVLLLAFDPTKPPFLGWSGSAGLWSAIFRMAPRAPRMEGINANSGDNYNYRYGRMPGMYGTTGVDNPLTSTLLQALASAKQLKTPPVSFIAWFLALYVFFLVPVNYCVLRYFDKRELAWITIPVIVVVFSVVSYAAALKIKGNAILMRQVNMVQSSQGSGIARADAMLWLFSPRKTTYDVTSNDAQMAVADYVDSDSAGSSVGTILQPDESTAFTLEDAAINMWDSRSFVGSSVINIGRGISLGRAGNKIVVENGTDRDLKGVVLLVGTSRVRIGAIKKGGTAAPVAVTTSTAGSNTSTMTDHIASESHLEEFLAAEERDNFRGIARALLNNALGSRYAKSRSGPLLIAWSQEPAAPLSIGYDDVRARSLSLYVIRLVNNDTLQRLVAQSPSSPGATGSTGSVGKLATK